MAAENLQEAVRRPVVRSSGRTEGRGLLRMRAREEGFAVPKVTQNDSGFGISPVDVKVLIIRGQYFHLAASRLFGIDEDSAPVEIGDDRGRQLRIEGVGWNFENGGSGPPLTVVLESLEGGAAAGSGIKSQFPGPYNLKRAVAKLKLASSTGIVGSGAEAKIGAAAADVATDAPVAIAIEDAAVAQVSTAGEDEEGTSGFPRLVEDGRARDGDDGVIGGQQVAKRVDALADRVGRGSGSWRPSQARMVWQERRCETYLHRQGR